MGKQEEIRDFLVSRRARITPAQAAVQHYPGTRRVPGLRREEVAHLAGVSVDYYTRLERGKTASASPQVLDAVARALQLDDVERDHLFDLVRPVPGRRGRPRRPHARPGLQLVLDALTVPALAIDAAMYQVAANHLAHALYTLYTLPGEAPARPFNHSMFMFLDPRARGFYRDWNLAKRNNVALLRAAAGRDARDKTLMTVIGRLTAQSEEFAALWAAHDVIRYRSGGKHYHHPVVGDLDFGYESFDIPVDPGLVMLVYTVEPGSPTEQALRLLDSWAPAEIPSPSAADSATRTIPESVMGT
jgi:transcriptional regulator with XRE-family HTH domain